MFLEEISGLPAIIGKKTVIVFSQEHTREHDVQEYKLHVVNASMNDDWFLYHFDLKYRTCLSKMPETNHKNYNTWCTDYENNFKSFDSHQTCTVEVTRRKKQKQTAFKRFKGLEPTSILPVVWFGFEKKCYFTSAKNVQLSVSQTFWNVRHQTVSLIVGLVFQNLQL